MPYAPIGLILLALGFAGDVQAAPKPDLSVARGQAVADRVCAPCHAVRVGKASPDPRAPPFGGREMGHTASLEGRVAQIARQGHYEMPPLRLTPAEVSDVAGFIASLQTPSNRDSRKPDRAIGR